MKTISVINLKGGVAKTTTSINMAAIMAHNFGLKVLIVDNDKQGNASKFFQKFSMNKTCGTADILAGKKPLIHKAFYNVDIITANMTLQAAENNLIMSNERQDNRMKIFLDSVANDYDVCIIDNPPAVSMCVINALCASDDVIIPVKLDDWSLDGVDVITEQIEALKQLNKGLKIAGVLVANYKKTFTNMAADEWLRRNCKVKVFETKIRHSAKIDESTYGKSPICIFSPKSAAAIDYKKMIKEYLKGAGIEQDRT